ncbi:MAG: protein-L-isoaspartate(D-aspartate) O-methyltransferase [Gammaproteobacteria bacterium]|nr:protein-L-isoaspartate(D-aspartate) O-methyltransferase [Gammaproteobacteria bacterium]
MTSRRTRLRLIDHLREAGIKNEVVLAVMLEIPRHIFMGEALASRAYENTALPIGYGQTISQPYIVARMTEALLSGGALGNVLEIGTGSGYQAAILARLVKTVYTVERISALFYEASKRFKELGLDNIKIQNSDGYDGWQAHAPFDGIIATAAPFEVPSMLLDQLADGGRLVIPIGDHSRQVLKLITRQGDQFKEESLEMVSFVPMVPGGR